VRKKEDIIIDYISVHSWAITSYYYQNIYQSIYLSLKL